MNSAPIAQLLFDYQALRRTQAGSDLPEMRAAGLQLQQHRHAQSEALWAAFSAYAPEQGWLKFQSQQLAFSNGLPSPAPAWGALLQAEAVTADGLSLAVHRLPGGDWTLIEKRHLDVGELLCDQLDHLAHDPRFGALRYRRYWTLDPELGPVQTTACFLGFQPNDTQGA
ncbi:MAG: hypothetical protein AB1412_04075 [Pseudomonadota bacterium]